MRTEGAGAGHCPYVEVTRTSNVSEGLKLLSNLSLTHVLERASLASQSRSSTRPSKTADASFAPAVSLNLFALHCADAHHDFAERDLVADVDGLRHVVSQRLVVDARSVGATQMRHCQAAVFKLQLRVLAMNVTFILIAQVDVGENLLFLVFAPDQNFVVA